MRSDDKGVSRRSFVKTSLAASAAAGGLTVLGTRSGFGQAQTPLKVGLVGCGGRGTGALTNHIDAAENLGIKVKVHALADVYKDQLEACRKLIKEQKGHDVPSENCFVGYDAYKKLIDVVDVVLLATPPVFRPLHFETIVEAGKHSFIEKPAGVDPVGCRRVIAAGEKAKEKGIAVVAGTQRRHQLRYLQGYKMLQDGVIGRILGGAVYWCTGQSWIKPRKPEWDDREYITRNWINFSEMSGDHIIEQHVHNIDVMIWFAGALPQLAAGFGHRVRRKTGNCFDFFSVDYRFDDRIHINSMSRQINRTWAREGEELVGEKGVALSGRVKTFERKRLKKPDIDVIRNQYVQEHIDLLDSIVKDKPLNEAETMANSTLAGIMGRIAAYKGTILRWTDVAEESGRFGKLKLSPAPEDFETGFEKAGVTIPKDDVIPVPGEA